jgi:uncharacterized protein GlcG (DUF336 family)/MFS family permease
MQNLPAGRSPDGGRGRATLMLCHFVGMVDLVALPVWVGTLAQHHGYDLEHAGMVVTAFLLGAVGASLAAAPLFNRLPRSACAAGGYAIAALAFLGAAQASTFGGLAALHLLAGVATGIALSVVHGTIGRSANPHKLFAIVGTALGIGAVLFYAAVPPAIAAHGGATLFLVFAGLMALAALACAAGFPQVAAQVEGRAVAAPLPRAAWFAILGVACLALNQALIFSMLDRIGVLRGFGQERVNGVLLVCGLVNLLPAAVAGLLQKRPRSGARRAAGRALAGGAGAGRHAVARLPAVRARGQRVSGRADLHAYLFVRPDRPARSERPRTGFDAGDDDDRLGHRTGTGRRGGDARRLRRPGAAGRGGRRRGHPAVRPGGAPRRRASSRHRSHLSLKESIMTVTAHLTLAQANTILAAALAAARAGGLPPVAVVVLDAAGHPVALQREDGASMLRADIAQGKAWAAAGMGVASGVLHQRAQDNPVFFNALSASSQGRFIPQAGAVAIRAPTAPCSARSARAAAPAPQDEAICAAGVDAAGLVAA